MDGKGSGALSGRRQRYPYLGSHHPSVWAKKSQFLRFVASFCERPLQGGTAEGWEGLRMGVWCGRGEGVNRGTHRSGVKGM